MVKLKIGVLCPSEIALRRFMPALVKMNDVEFVGIAHADEVEWFGQKSTDNDLSILEKDLNKAREFTSVFGGTVFNSFKELLLSDKIDAVYIPLPPALHYEWAKFALQNGKHVFVEKPSTTLLKDTIELVEIAKEKKLALHENYMFNFHTQIAFIENLIKSGTIGDVRLFRIAFGFPFRGANDFRYVKKLGGGALLDCGGYTIKLATRLLGGDVELDHHQLNYLNEFDVDIYGSGTLINKRKQVAQISFGMDNSYKCELEVWGSRGCIFTNRILTAPEGFKPTVTITKGNNVEQIELESDDSFMKSISYFVNCINDESLRLKTLNELIIQEEIVSKFMEEK